MCPKTAIGEKRQACQTTRRFARCCGAFCRKSGEIKRKAAIRLRLFFLVPVAGIEPARCCHRGILSPLRLPVPPHRHKPHVTTAESILSSKRRQQFNYCRICGAWYTCDTVRRDVRRRSLHFAAAYTRRLHIYSSVLPFKSEQVFGFDEEKRGNGSVVFGFSRKQSGMRPF